jgi:hypothetical protein
MNRFLENHQHEKKIEIKKLKYDDNTQDYTLCVGMPLMARINNKKMNIYNNETYICEKITNETIEVKSLINIEKHISIKKDDFSKLFNLAFCITTHKSLGLSIDEPYCIHEFHKFGRRMKYVALSRSTNYDNIKII